MKKIILPLWVPSTANNSCFVKINFFYWHSPHKVLKEAEAKVNDLENENDLVTSIIAPQSFELTLNSRTIIP